MQFLSILTRQVFESIEKLDDVTFRSLDVLRSCPKKFWCQKNFKDHLLQVHRQILLVAFLTPLIDSVFIASENFEGKTRSKQSKL